MVATMNFNDFQRTVSGWLEGVDMSCYEKYGTFENLCETVSNDLLEHVKKSGFMYGHCIDDWISENEWEKFLMNY